MTTTRRSRPRVCLLTPGHLSTNPRLVKEADALSESGFDVSVIAADYALWARDADRSFAGRRWRVVRTLPFGPHAPRLPRAKQLLRRHAARAVRAMGDRHPGVTHAAWHPIAPDIVKAALRVSADLYIAHYPAALPAAAIAAKRHGARCAFDAEDFHLGDLPATAKHEAEREMVRAIEGRYLPECAYVTAASPGIADAYVEAYKISKPTVVLNVFPRSHAAPAPTPRGTTTPGPSLYWFSQTIGPDRGLECAVRAIARSRSRPHLYLRGTPANGFLDHMRAIAKQSGVAAHLHILPPALPGEMVDLAAAYDVGLAGETGHTPNRKIALTNKQFTYLSAGIPMVMSDVVAHRSIAPALGKAAVLYSIDDPANLAAALDSFLDTPKGLAAARSDAWHLGQGRFNWEQEQEALLRCVRETLGIAPHRHAGAIACTQ